MSKYIIDILKEEYKDFPITLDGEVFIEKTYDSNNNLSGYITTTIDRIMSLKNKTDEELTKLEWTKYKHILDTFQEGG